MQLPGPSVRSFYIPSFDTIHEAISSNKQSYFYDSYAMHAIYILESIKSLSYENISITKDLAEIFFINTGVIKNDCCFSEIDGSINDMVRVYEKEIIDYYQNNYNEIIEMVGSRFFICICKNGTLKIPSSTYKVFKEAIAICSRTRTNIVHISGFEQLNNKINAMYSIAKNEVFNNEKEYRKIRDDEKTIIKDDEYISLHKNDIMRCQAIFHELKYYQTSSIISQDAYKKCIINLLLFFIYSHMNLYDNRYFYNWEFSGDQKADNSITMNSVSRFIRNVRNYSNNKININALPNISKQAALISGVDIEYDLNPCNNLDSDGKDLLLSIMYFKGKDSSCDHGDADEICHC